jgi:IS30 family transposase
MGKIYTQLSLEERMMIQAQLSMGFKPGRIARELGRLASTLSQEFDAQWLGSPESASPSWSSSVAGGYCNETAHRRAHACTVTPRVARRLQPGTALWDQVTRYLKASYSPEQIAGTLALVHPDMPSLQVSHETIDTANYAMPRGALRTDVIGRLRYGPAKRPPRARGDRRSARWWNAPACS